MFKKRHIQKYANSNPRKLVTKSFFTNNCTCWIAKYNTFTVSCMFMAYWVIPIRFWCYKMWLKCFKIRFLSVSLLLLFGYFAVIWWKANFFSNLTADQCQAAGNMQVYVIEFRFLYPLQIKVQGYKGIISLSYTLSSTWLLHVYKKNYTKIYWGITCGPSWKSVARLKCHFLDIQ